MKRLFIAIKLIPDDNLLKIYHSLKQALRYDKIRWVNPENFHLTIKFLGKTSEDKIDVISYIINETLSSYSSIDIEVNKIGIFGSSYKPRVIWFGIKDHKQLKSLAVELINNLNAAGFPKDRQNFVPHFTIGRITKVTDKKAFNNTIAGIKDEFIQYAMVNTIILYESILSPKGPQYKEINSFSLK